MDVARPVLGDRWRLYDRRSDRGKLELGAEMFGVAALFAVALVVGRRSETVRGFTQADSRDERFAALDLRATAIAGTTIVIAILIGFVVALARGDNGEPYIWLGVLGGVAYLVALLILRARD